MRLACFTSSGIAMRSWSMRSSIAACSSMTLFVIGTFRALTTSASRRSTRNWMSMSSSRSGLRVPQEQQRFLPDVLHAHDREVGRQCGTMLAQHAGDDDGTGRELERPGWRAVEIAEDVRGDDRCALGEARRLKVPP